MLPGEASIEFVCKVCIESITKTSGSVSSMFLKICCVLVSVKIKQLELIASNLSALIFI